MVYRVFLSSTSQDLVAHREEVLAAIVGLDGFSRIAVENFGARACRGGDRHDHKAALSARPILVHSRYRRTGEAPMNRIDEPERPPDFFISRAGADAPFAAEVGRVLEDAGHTVVLQQWDFANRNFMERMHAALKSGARVIALLSNEYLASDHCAAEWQNAIAHDPLNKRGRLVVLRVAESTPTGLLTALAYWDLVPVRGDRALLRDIVLTAVQPGRHKDDAARAAQYWRGPRPVVHSEIKATPSFTDREGELSRLHELLGAGHTAAVTQPVAAHGLGGIGKSVLAREYAHRNRGDYAGVWWLNAAKPDDGTPGFEGVERALIDLGAIFIRGLDQVEDRGRAARQTLDFLAHGGFDKPWLLVYDNVDDARVLREWAPAGNGHVLVTSRLSGWPSTVKPIEIEEWELPDAISLSAAGERALRSDRERRRRHRRGARPPAARALARGRAAPGPPQHQGGGLPREPDPTHERSATRCRVPARGVRDVQGGVRGSGARGARRRRGHLARRLLRPG